MSSPDPMPPPRLGWLGLLLIGLVGHGCSDADESESAPASAHGRAIVRDLLEREGLFEVIAGRADAPPSRGELCPAPFDNGVDGSDLPALLLPPPAEVRLVAPSDEGELWLTGAAGVHFEAGAAGGERGARVLFEVRLDGEPVFDASSPVAADPSPLAWTRFGEGVGLAVPPGAELVLSTRAVDARGREWNPPEGLRAGFGRLRLERARSLPRLEAGAPVPNLVLVVQDTLRRDRTSLHGHARATTPRLDALAAEGLVYDAAYSTSSWTWPATASLLTGLTPETHGVTDPASCHLPTALDTLAERLQERGYATAAFSGNPIVLPGKNLDQGFEHFDFARGRFRKSPELVPAALAWIRAHADRRFFVYLHLVDAHDPYEAAPEAAAAFGSEAPADWSAARFRELQESGKRGGVTPREDERRWLDDSYDGAVWTGDRELGRVLDLLGELGLEDETVVAFTSDHGEELFDRGALGHGHTLHRELVSVPLVLAGPGLPAGTRVSTPVSNRHLAPTLARLGGAPFEALPDALDLARPEELAERPVRFSSEQGFWRGRGATRVEGITYQGWTLHRSPRAEELAPAGLGTRLFGPQDGAEREDRSRAEAERVATLEDLLAASQEAARRARPTAPFPAGEATRGALEDIGYFGEPEDH